VSVFTVGVGIALFVSDVLRIMSTPPFHPAADVVPIILVAYVFHGWAQMHDIGVLVKERTEYLTIANWVAALVALGAFAVLIPRFLAFGAAFAAVLAFSVRWGLTYFFSQRLWRVQYDWAPLARLAVAAAVVVGTGLFLPRLGLVASIALHSLLFLAYLVLLLVLPILTPGEKQAAVQIVRRRLRLGGRDVVADTPSLRPPS
jgi:O-antigen/teichoic acid export membrane protein